MDQEKNVNQSDDVHDIENEGLLDGKEIERCWSEVSDKNLSYTKPLLVKRTNTTSQIAIVGANVCPIESLDYENCSPIRKRCCSTLHTENVFCNERLKGFNNFIASSETAITFYQRYGDNMGLPRLEFEI
ncbi:chloride channel protein clc-c [Quercus suber]|uniref:Chloride channel protein clc-c n=1 Tax=Quercus suber TaxID=58331 RepID=A0AAW0IDN8_QUESU